MAVRHMLGQLGKLDRTWTVLVHLSQMCLPLIRNWLRISQNPCCSISLVQIDNWRRGDTWEILIKWKKQEMFAICLWSDLKMMMMIMIVIWLDEVWVEVTYLTDVCVWVTCQQVDNLLVYVTVCLFVCLVRWLFTWLCVMSVPCGV